MGPACVGGVGFSYHDTIAELVARHLDPDAVRAGDGPGSQ
jgi:hypothetical protein